MDNDRVALERRMKLYFDKSVSFDELKRIRIPPGFEVECETNWKVRKAIEIEKIRIGNHWSQPEEPKKDPSRKEETDDARIDYGVGRDH